jgi:methionine sulfoxide reductase heme-binding subunit
MIDANRRILRALVFAASLSPIAFMLWDASTNLNAIPFNTIVRSTGFWCLRFLCLTLAITPLRWLTGWHSLVKFRRMMGLFGFFYGTVHTAAYVVFDRAAGLDESVRAQPLAATAHTLSAIGADLLRPFFAIGLIALVLMVPLAATSTAGMIRRLGGRRWQALHRFAYAAAVASVLHTYWPLTLRSPRYALILGVIFVLRLGRAYARSLSSTPRTVPAAIDM